MNLLDNKLETLLAVSEFKSFTTASKILNLTQPAVSQHISQLEKEFNITIFNKTSNGLILTKEGEILVKYARRLKALSKEALTKISDEKKEARLIRVGITHSLEGNLITQVFAEMAKNNKNTTIKIYSEDIKNLYDKLNNYELDLAIVEGKVTSSKLSKTLLDTDSVMVVMSKDNPLAKKSIITISDVQKEKLILRHSKSATRSLFMSNLYQIGMSLDDFVTMLEIDNTSTIKDLIKQNIGISVLPKSVCLNEIKNKTLVVKPIQDLDMTAEINLLYNKQAVDENILQQIIDIYESIK